MNLGGPKRILRPFVMKHGDTYYLFGVKNENGDTVDDNIILPFPASCGGGLPKMESTGTTQNSNDCGPNPGRGFLINVSVLVDSGWHLENALPSDGRKRRVLWPRCSTRWYQVEEIRGQSGDEGLLWRRPLVVRIGDRYYVWHSQGYKTAF